jgi:hypothetical protein
VLYHHGLAPIALRQLLVMRRWPAFVDKDGLRRLLRAVLQLAAEHLRARGKDEERFLAPLFERAERLSNPALELLAQSEKGASAESLIARWGEV